MMGLLAAKVRLFALLGLLRSGLSENPPSLSLFGKPSEFDVVRGVAYQPTIPGFDSKWVPGSDLNDVYSVRYASLHARDMSLIASMGANSLFLMNGFHEQHDHRNFLNLAANHNLFVIVPFFPEQPFPDGVFDIADVHEAQAIVIEQRFRKLLQTYQGLLSSRVNVLLSSVPLYRSSSRSCVVNRQFPQLDLGEFSRFVLAARQPSGSGER